MTQPIADRSKRVNVLLVSPRLPATHKHYHGDHAYTDTMLDDPPAGVCYTHYEDLIACGQMRRIRVLQSLSYHLRDWTVLPPDLWFEALRSDYAPSLLHIYGFSAAVRLPKNLRHVPVILGAGTGSYSDLKYYLGWDERRIRWARWRKRQYHKYIHAHDASLRPENAARVLVWSEFSRRMHLDEGYVRPDQIKVLYPGLRWKGTKQLRDDGSDGLTFLFVGGDFERKNGPLALEAFRQVRAKHPATRLVLVGRPADGRRIEEPGVSHYEFLPREELFDRIYPQADVLVLPSKGEGFGLVLLEAMSFGMPVIGVDAWAMPEIVQDGVNGFLIKPDSLDGLVDRMLRLVSQQDLLAQMRQQAQRIFEERFSIKTHNQRLGSIYDEVLEETGRKRA